MTRIVLTPHAIERYMERVRPTLDLGAAASELERLARTATPVEHAPVWTQGVEVEAHAPLSDGIALLLERSGNRWVALTCVARGGMSEARRAAVNRRKAAGRRAKARARREAVRGRRRDQDAA